MMKNPHPARRRVYMLLGFFGAFLLLFSLLVFCVQYMWIGKNNNFNLVVVNSLLNEENYDECKLIANKHNLIFCSVEELDGYLKILAG